MILPPHDCIDFSPGAAFRRSLQFIDALPSSAHPMTLLLPRHHKMLVVVVVVVIVIGYFQRFYYENS